MVVKQSYQSCKVTEIVCFIDGIKLINLLYVERRLEPIKLWLYHQCLTKHSRVKSDDYDIWLVVLRFTNLKQWNWSFIKFFQSSANLDMAIVYSFQLSNLQKLKVYVKVHLIGHQLWNDLGLGLPTVVCAWRLLVTCM